MANQTGIQEYVAPLREKARALRERALQYTVTGATLPDELKRAIQEKIEYARPVREKQAEALAAYVAAPARAREKYGTPELPTFVFNPFARERLVAEERAQALAPYALYSGLLGTIRGGIGEAVGAGQRAWQAASQYASGLAQMAQDEYARALEQAWRETELAARMQMQQQQLATQLAIAKMRRGGGGIGLSGILSLAKFLQPTATEEMAAINAKSGLRAAQQIRDVLERNKGALFWARVPLVGRLIGGEDAQTLQDAGRELVDILARLRTGAVLNPQEIKIYNANLPKWGTDKPATIYRKLQRLEQIYTDVINRAQPTSKLQTLGWLGGGSLLNQLGLQQAPSWQKEE